MTAIEQAADYRADAAQLATVPDLAKYASMYRHIAEEIEAAGEPLKEHAIYLLCKDFPLELEKK